MKSRRGFYSKLGYYKGVVKEFVGEGEVPP